MRVITTQLRATERIKKDEGKGISQCLAHSKCSINLGCDYTEAPGEPWKNMPVWCERREMEIKRSWEQELGGAGGPPELGEGNHFRISQAGGITWLPVQGLEASYHVNGAWQEPATSGLKGLPQL